MGNHTLYSIGELPQSDQAVELLQLHLLVC